MEAQDDISESQGRDIPVLDQRAFRYSTSTFARSLPGPWTR